MAVHLAADGDIFDGVLFCAVLFPHKMSWMRSGTELSQFLRVFSLPTLVSSFFTKGLFCLLEMELNAVGRQCSVERIHPVEHVK